MAHSNREKRRAQRKAQKQAKKTAWVTLIGTSQNKKRAKATGNNTRRPPAAKVKRPVIATWQGRTGIGAAMVHQGPKCFNIGCKRCSPLWRIA